MDEYEEPSRNVANVSKLSHKWSNVSALYCMQWNKEHPINGGMVGLQWSHVCKWIIDFGTLKEIFVVYIYICETRHGPVFAPE